MAKKGVKTPVNVEIVLFGKAVCGNCYHWDRIEEVNQRRDADVAGECLLNPPVVLDIDEEGMILQASPVKFFRSRCGQYQPQEH